MSKVRIANTRPTTTRACCSTGGDASIAWRATIASEFWKTLAAKKMRLFVDCSQPDIGKGRQHGPRKIVAKFGSCLHLIIRNVGRRPVRYTKLGSATWFRINNIVMRSTWEVYSLEGQTFTFPLSPARRISKAKLGRAILSSSAATETSNVSWRHHNGPSRIETWKCDDRFSIIIPEKCDFVGLLRQLDMTCSSLIYLKHHKYILFLYLEPIGSRSVGRESELAQILVWEQPDPEGGNSSSTLRRYSFGLRLAIAQADARPVMPISFR